MLSNIGKMLLRPPIVAASLLTILGLVFAVGGVRLGLWADGGPGAGLLPTTAAVLLLTLVLAMMLTSTGEKDERFRREPLIAIGLCCAYAFLAPRIGVVLPTFLLVAIWVTLLHGQSLLRACLISAGLTAAGVLIFHILLKVPMTLVVGIR
jgi:cell division protein FtsW (lipid II flippase)